MEWVETTGRTVAEALDAALDELGVDEDEVEYEVVQEPKGGLLGRKEARIRARVKPISREKPGERRRRDTRRRGGKSGGDDARRRPNTQSGEGGGNQSRPSGGSGQRRRRGGRSRSSGGGDTETTRTKREEAVSETEVPVEDQARAAEDFTRGLVEAFGADATVEAKVDDEAVLVDVTGNDLGLLVGPKGADAPGDRGARADGRAAPDRGPGRGSTSTSPATAAKRREALRKFVADLADKVRETGRDQALEPMSASDRKIVHDAVAELDGVDTISEGEDPRRRVVVRKA